MNSEEKAINEKLVFAPGCALMLYKPDLAYKVLDFFNKNMEHVELFLTCCQHEPGLSPHTKIINVCPGCDKRFGDDYPDISTVSLWEILAESDSFNFPDYNGMSMTINDACPTRDQDRVHIAIRKLLSKMNINLIEPVSTRRRSICCGDTFYGILPTEKVKEFMIKRSSEMPLEDVIVYCISCLKSFYNGGKKPRYLIDLLFREESFPQTYDPDEWHKELSEYINKH
jgi:Fe-S oxidoreductase